MTDQHETPASHCPYCDNLLDMASGTDKDDPRQPSPGDASVCLHCAQVLIFDPLLTLRKPLPGELETKYQEAPGIESHLRRVQRLVRTTDRRSEGGHK
jgi:hypothetical protein